MIGDGDPLVANFQVVTLQRAQPVCLFPCGELIEGPPEGADSQAGMVRGAGHELEFNAGEGIDPLLYLSINQGVGAGVIVTFVERAGTRTENDVNGESTD